jgi:aspartyl-tRNA(Asn)/glutamyl-tRNA(Gln) amidotransferase subunit B
LEEVRSRLIFAGVADCKMEEGGMRCDVNLSLKLAGSKTLGNRTETKNLNSFKMVTRAIEYETNRQRELLEDGKTITTETRKWNDASGKTTSMRNKEESQDYRYFPDPDIYPIKISRAVVDDCKSRLPILAHQLRDKFAGEFGLPDYDAAILTKTKETAEFYLSCVALLKEPKKISNWLMVDVAFYMNENNLDAIPISAKDLTDIIAMVESKKITKTVGLQLMTEVIKKKKPAKELAEKMGLFETISDAEILKILAEVAKANPKVADDYRARPDKVLPFIIGQVMKQTRGKAKSEDALRLLPKVFN